MVDDDAREQVAAADHLIRNWLAKDGSQLTPVGLSAEELEQQMATLDELQRVLSDQHRQVKIKFVSLAGAEATPRAIFDRIAFHRQRSVEALVHLQWSESAAAIQDVVEERVDDPAVRAAVDDLITKLARQQEEIDANLASHADLTAAGRDTIEFHKAKLAGRMEMLRREPAAVFVGAVLLFGFSVVLAVAMFTHTEVPEILSSAFLLILGFFFGQAVSGSSKTDE